jgi:hypothetical protein
MVCKFQVEIDPFCNKVLEKHWPDVRRYKDVREVHGINSHAKRNGCNETEEQRSIRQSNGESRVQEFKGLHGTSRSLPFQLVPSKPRTEGTGLGLLRTPDANMERGPRTEENLKDRYLVRKMPLCLNDQMAMVEKGMLPTPATRDYKGANSQEHTEKGRGHMCQLPNAITHGTNRGLKLQPAFVLWMCGYPEDWLDLKDGE